MEVCRQRGWGRRGSKPEGAERGRGPPPISPPTLPKASPDWLLDRRAQVTFSRRAERGREDPRAERLVWPRSAASPLPQSPHPAPHRPPAPASVPAKGPQHQHGLLHRKLEGLGDGHSAWTGGRGTREAPVGRARDGSGCRRPSSNKGAC